MKNNDKKLLKEIEHHKNLDTALPGYVQAYMDTAYEYSLIHLVLNYYTMKEVQDEAQTAREDPYLTEVMSRLHTMIFETLVMDQGGRQIPEVTGQLKELRKEVTARMTAITAYTDALQIYEYVLNRVEYGIKGETVPVDADALAAKVFRYLFRENDKMVINSKIQMVTGQLPVRMTKSRFYEYLTSTLMIYNGSDRSAVDDFVSMLKSTALLELPDGFEDTCPKIRQVVRRFEETDFKTLGEPEFKELSELLSFTTSRLTDLVSDYLLVMGMINDLYAVLLAFPHQNSQAEGTGSCLSMLKGLHAAYLSEGEIPESVNEGFEQIEGIQEQLGEDLLQFEGHLQDVQTEYGDRLKEMALTEQAGKLVHISRLLSNSLFIDIELEQTEEEKADQDYIMKKRDELKELTGSFFETHPKEVNRAVMAAMFSSMPVLFNSQQEIQDYISYSLNHCGSESELTACEKLLRQMMEEA